MKRTWPIIAVSDVQAGSRWYQTLLNCENNHPGDPEFDQILDSDGTVLVCLHRWGDHHHPSLASPGDGRVGNGLLLFFRVEDFDSALDRAFSLVAELEEEPHINPNTKTMEFSVRDPEGYYVTISSIPAA